jgi:hypothetical protein
MPITQPGRMRDHTNRAVGNYTDEYFFKPRCMLARGW